MNGKLKISEVCENNTKEEKKISLKQHISLAKIWHIWCKFVMNQDESSETEDSFAIEIEQVH